MANREGQAPAWLPRLKQFAVPVRRAAILQLIDTLVPYAAAVALMYVSMRSGAPWWTTLLIAVPAGGFLVRAFILFHDCCHGSFLKSRRAMDAIGAVLGILTFTPYQDWRHAHGVHHSSVGNLDRRGIGDVWTMTADEYRSAQPLRRFLYRAYRHPIILFGFGPLFLFLIINRFPTKGAKPAQVRSVMLTNIAVLVMAVTGSLLLGLREYLVIQLSVLFFAALAGIWLFYIQHQFDPTYWARSDDWQSLDAALLGSSFYKLPPLLRWFSGNIGLHHIHHLNPRIPNYRLQECLKAIPELKLEHPLTLGRSFAAVSLNLWDEARRKLVSFREFRRSERAARAPA